MKYKNLSCDFIIDKVFFFIKRIEYKLVSLYNLYKALHLSNIKKYLVQKVSSDFNYL